MTLSQRLDTKFWLGAAFILAYFCYWTADGLRAYFVPDDLMAEYYYWSRPTYKLFLANLFPFTNYFRPLGGLFYSGLFKVFGFNPLAFQLVRFSLSVLNIWLAWCFVRRLSGSREIAALAALIGCVHALMADVYYGFGAIYDVLCCTFYVSASLYYVRVRQSSVGFTVRRVLILLGLYLLALNAKEMAATLPVTLGLYEALFQRPRLRDLRGLLAVALITPLVYWGKMRPGYDNQFSGQGAYHIHIQWKPWIDATSAYLSTLAYWVKELTRVETVLIILLTLAIAWALRSKVLLWAAVFPWITLLPVSFIPARSAFVLQIPMVAWATYAATLLITLRDAVLGPLAHARGSVTDSTPTAFLSRDRQGAVLRSFSQIALFAAWTLAYAPVLAKGKTEWTHWVTDKQHTMRTAFDQFRALHPKLPHHARILFLDDPLDKDEYTLLFFLRLYYQDVEIEAYQVKKDPKAAEEHPEYDFLMTVKDGKFVDLTPHMKNGLRSGPEPETMSRANVF